jgi:hypothetical protein
LPRFLRQTKKISKIKKYFFAKPIAFFQRACYNNTVYEFIRVRTLSVVCGRSSINDYEKGRCTIWQTSNLRRSA